MRAPSAVGEERDMEERTQPLRVVVAGVGAVTSQGAGVEELWAGVRAGRVAIRPVQRLPMDGYRTRLGGEVDEFDPPTHTYRFPPGHRERVIDFALKAAEEAVDASLLPPGTVAPERWGVVMGTCNAGLLSFETWYAGRVSGQQQPAELLQLTTPQALAEAVSGAFECKGPVLSL